MKLLWFMPIFTFVLAGCSNGQVKRTNKPVVEFQKGDKMDENEFWKIINYSNEVAGVEIEKQDSIIVEKLSQYDTGQIVDFETIFSKKVIQANDYKILAADKIIDGSVTDDSFLYFKCWLISLGKEAFEQTLINPDNLVRFTDKGILPDHESLLYVSTKAYQNVTGKKQEDDSFPRDVVFKKGINYESDGPALTGKKWTDDQLPKLYPILWNKFN